MILMQQRFTNIRIINISSFKLDFFHTDIINIINDDDFIIFNSVIYRFIEETCDLLNYCL